MSRKLSSNMEDYLETILLLRDKNRFVRVRDISRVMSVKASSVTSALETLSQKGLVLHERYGFVQLTPEGVKLAKDIHKRHKILVIFLTKILGISHKIAADDACKMEHSMSPQTFERLTSFIEFIEKSPANGRPQWLKAFYYYLETGKRKKCPLSRFEETRSGQDL